MKYEKDKTKTIITRINEELNNDITEYCNKFNISTSILIREALKQYLDNTVLPT